MRWTRDSARRYNPIMARKHRDDLLALGLILVVAALFALGFQFATFRLFFGWPVGGTWSNTFAWLEDGGLALFFLWYFRDHVGRRLAAWWHKHHGPHLQAQLDAHHDRIVQTIKDNGIGH